MINNRELSRTAIGTVELVNRSTRASATTVKIQGPAAMIAACPIDATGASKFSCCAQASQSKADSGHYPSSEWGRRLGDQGACGIAEHISAAEYAMHNSNARAAASSLRSNAATARSQAGDALYRRSAPARRDRSRSPAPRHGRSIARSLDDLPTRAYIGGDTRYSGGPGL